MKLTAEGDYRVKGVFNEQNQNSIYQGAEVILRSRVDDTTWNGTVTEIDTSPQQNNGGGMYYGEGDEQSNSSKYAFYVEPESLDGFMLGQHILIDTDSGSDVEKTGIWLYEDFIQKDGEKSFVWAKKSDKDVIEKRYITIGQTDEDYGDCEITDGLSTDDYIAYPADYIKAGLTTTTNSSDKDIPENDIGGMDDEGGMMTEDEGMMEEGMDEEDMGGENDFVMNDDGSYSMTDENGNTVEVRTDGSGVITSPDGGVVEVDNEGNCIRGSIDEETGEYIFDYSGEPAESEEGAENGGASAFEELYGITEEEFNAMTPEELDAFMKEHYNN